MRTQRFALSILFLVAIAAAGHAAGTAPWPGRYYVGAALKYEVPESRIERQLFTQWPGLELEFAMRMLPAGYLYVRSGASVTLDERLAMIESPEDLDIVVRSVIAVGFRYHHYMDDVLFYGGGGPRFGTAGGTVEGLTLQVRNLGVQLTAGAQYRVGKRVVLGAYYTLDWRMASKVTVDGLSDGWQNNLGADNPTRRHAIAAGIGWLLGSD